MTDEIHVGAIGLIIELTITEGGSAVNIASATTKTIRIKKPDGTVVNKSAEFSTDGSDGKIRYTTVAGDLVLPGTYEVQGYVAWATFEGYSSIETFKVHPNL